MARITGLFDTRRAAEMAIERLVQDRGFERRIIAVHRLPAAQRLIGRLAQTG